MCKYSITSDGLQSLQEQPQNCQAIMVRTLQIAPRQPMNHFQITSSEAYLRSISPLEEKRHQPLASALARTKLVFLWRLQKKRLSHPILELSWERNPSVLLMRKTFRPREGRIPVLEWIRTQLWRQKEFNTTDAITWHCISVVVHYCFSKP